MTTPEIKQRLLAMAQRLGINPAVPVVVDFSKKHKRITLTPKEEVYDTHANVIVAH